VKFVDPAHQPEIGATGTAAPHQRSGSGLQIVHAATRSFVPVVHGTQQQVIIHGSFSEGS